MADEIRLKFFTNQIKGLASILISVKNKNILIDPGMPHSKFMSKAKKKLLDRFQIPKLDQIIISHYHGDHASLTGEILKTNLYRGEIITHKATSDIIQTYYHISPGFRSRFTGLDYEKVYQIDRDISITLFNAGHVLGSAMIYLTISQHHILISGDMGARSLPIVSDPQKIFPGKSLSLLVLDSKNADSTHQVDLEKHSLGTVLYQQLSDCLRYDDGNILMYMPKIHVPIFIYCLNYLFTNSRYNHIRQKIKNVYLEADSFGVQVNQLFDIFNQYVDLFDRREREFGGLDKNQFDFHELRQHEPDFATLKRSLMIAFTPEKFANWFRLLRKNANDDLLLLALDLKQILKAHRHLIEKKYNINVKHFPRIYFHPDKQELVDWCQQLQRHIKIKHLLFYHHPKLETKSRLKSIFNQETGIPVTLEHELPERTMVIPLS